MSMVLNCRWLLFILSVKVKVRMFVSLLVRDSIIRILILTIIQTFSSFSRSWSRLMLLVFLFKSIPNILRILILHSLCSLLSLWSPKEGIRHYVSVTHRVLWLSLMSYLSIFLFIKFALCRSFQYWCFWILKLNSPCMLLFERVRSWSNSVLNLLLNLKLLFH